jgi:TolB-like protein/tetratricopeptide (TPR) repeat protein
VTALAAPYLGWIAPAHQMTSEHLPRVREALAGRYDVERELGAGGMATVYLARDRKHDRPVALKVLRPELSAALGAERFHAEIKVTARLTHPHILALYDSGEAAGMLYYVMPYVEGESLRDRLSREKRLPVEEALRIASAVSGALAYAHAHEVVHRDIKPENIMLQNGHALVADFGIARAVGAAGADRLTVTGLLLGTPLYMSPEQASGEVVIDGRSDVYSLACVLFEMLTGEAPFTGATMQAVIAKRFTQSAPSAIEKRGDVPKAIDQALRRALVRDPGERVASATQFTEMLAAAMMAAQAVASGGARGDRSGDAEVPCIAVLPFTNMSADQEAEFFSDGITEEILNALAKLGGLRVIARTSSFAFKGKSVDVREIGKALGAGHILEGSVRKSGNKLRITAQLIEARSGHHLWSEKYDRDMSDIFAVQDEVTAAIRDELSKHLLGIGQVVTLATQSIDAETYEAFLRGRHLLDQRAEGMRQGIQLLKQVVERAPAYAPGHAMLSSAFAILGFYCVMPPKDAFGLARSSAQRALELDPTDSRAHVLAGHCALFLDWNWSDSEKHYALAEEKGGADFWAMGAGSFRLASIGQHDEAIARARRAIETDPLNPSAHTHCATILTLGRRFEEGLAACERCIEIAPDYSEAYRFKGMIQMFQGRLEGARTDLRRAVDLSRRHPWSVMNLIEAENRLGHVEEARALVAELRERAAREYIPAYLDLYESRIGDHPDLDRAFTALDRMIDAREFWLVMLRADAAVDWIRQDPRFEGVCRRVGIPAWAG